VKDLLLKYAKELLLKYGKYVKYAGMVGYPAFYVSCLALFFSCSFPYDKLKERLVATFNADQRTMGGQEELQIDEMQGYWLSGVRLKGVRLLSMSTDPAAPLSRIDIDEATVRYDLVPALFGAADTSFHVYAFGGETSGSYEVHGLDKSLEATLDTLNIGQIEPLVRILGVPLAGKLSGTIKVEMPGGKASNGSGSVSLEARDVVVGDGKAKLKGALVLPPIDVGVVTLTADAKSGTLKLSKLAATGHDLDLQGEGRVLMREVMSESVCDVQVRFKINDAYRSKNDIAKSLFGDPGSSIPPLFEIDPQVKQSKRADGFYAWNIRGALARPDMVPAGMASGAFGGMPKTGQ
jgi:type II secretion system protein N